MRLLCSLQSPVYVLHVLNVQTMTVKPEQTTLNLGEKTRASNVSFTNSLNLVGEFAFCSLQGGKCNPIQTGKIDKWDKVS